MTPHNCKRPEVVNMDHVQGYYPDLRPMVNRICRTCGWHWYGDAGVAVVEMPGKVWGAWMEGAA